MNKTVLETKQGADTTADLYYLLFDGDPSRRFCGIVTEKLQHLVCRCEALSRQHYNVFCGTN